MRIGKTCYICLKPIRDTEEKVQVDEKLKRHTRCAPGTENWLRSVWGRTSPLRSLFANDK